MVVVVHDQVGREGCSGTCKALMKLYGVMDE